MTVSTLADLAALCETHRNRDVIIIDVHEWRAMRDFVPFEYVVAATADRPAFFWFLDKKIVTPAWAMAEQVKNPGWRPWSAPADSQFICPNGGTHLHRLTDDPADCPSSPWYGQRRAR